MRARLLCALVAATLLSASLYAGQGPRGRGDRQASRRAAFATAADFTGGFQFCRLVFRNGPNGDGAGWSVDWPRADDNLSTRLSELSRTPVSVDGNGKPRALLLTLQQPEVYRCPLLIMTEPGGALFDENEVSNLRTYLLKGGFLWADDFWGEYAWDYWDNQLRRVLPSGEFPTVDLPRTHVIFHQMFSLRDLPQIPGIGYWDGADRTWERRDARDVHYRAVTDTRGRVMVLMTHNTDFGDSYEEEATDPDYFLKFSVPGYAFGINVVVYAMTH